MIKREIYGKVIEAIEENKIPIVMGMRRVGKTTMLKQIEEEFENVRYITWDDFKYLILTEHDFFTFLDGLCAQGGILLFDEIQERQNWDKFIKNMFDKYVVEGICKIVVTGSSSMILSNKDLGVTRTRKILIDTWNFDEYTELTKKEKTLENFENFLGYGFPEFMDGKKTFDEMLNYTLKPIIENDLLRAFPGTDTLALMRFISQIAFLSNGEVNETSLAQKVGISIPTVRKYIDILERSLLLKRVFRINSDSSMPKKKQYKVFLNPHLQIWLLDRNFNSLDNKYKGHIIESYWLHWAKGISGFDKTFYYLKDTKTNKEVDFVSLNPDGSFKTLHEFKYKNKIDFNELQQVISLPSNNKIIWGKKTKQEDGFKYISILDINNN